MPVQSIIYRIAFILMIIAMCIEIAGVLFSMIKIIMNPGEDYSVYKEVFESGIKLRNSSIVFLVCLLFMGNTSVGVGNLNIPAAIRQTSIMCLGCSVVLIVIVTFELVIASIKGITSGSWKEFSAKAFGSALLFGVVSALMMYVFSV